MGENRDALPVTGRPSLWLFYFHYEKAANSDRGLAGRSAAGGNQGLSQTDAAVVGRHLFGGIHLEVRLFQ